MASGRRLYPYELKPPPDWEERVQRMQETPLYLVNTTGPTCYSVRGEDSKKTYKIYIGDRQLCSCGGGKDWKDPQLCIHLLYVMIKVLRAPSTDPLSWQLSLLDAEVTQILQGRFKGRAPQEAKHTFLKKRGLRGGGEGGEGSGPSEDNGVERHELDEDEVCPICQEGMTVAQALTYCRKSCGNNMHVKCMKMYAEFQRSSTGTKVACPLCRVDWGGPVSVDPFPSHDHTEAGEGSMRPANPAQCRSVPIAHFRSSCGACQGPIAPPVPQAACPHTTFYRCLLCPATAPKRCTSTPDLCAGCFLRRAPLPNPHPAMPHTFIMAQLGPSSLTWLPPAPPLQQAQPTASLPTHLIASLQGRELGDGDYDLLLQLDAPNRRATSLPHYLLSLLAQPAQLPQAQPQAQPQAPEAGGEQAEGGQEGAEESHEAPEQEEAQAAAASTSADAAPLGPTSCGICTLPLLPSSSSSIASLRCLPSCGHVVHESCVLSALLEASALGAEALAALGCPTCRQPLFAALTLKAGRRRKKAAAADPTKADGTGQLHRRRSPGLVPQPLNAEALAGMFIGGRELLPSLAQNQHVQHPAAAPHVAAAHRTSQSAPQLRPLNGEMAMEEGPGLLEVGTGGPQVKGRQRSGRPPQRASSEGGRPRPRLRPRPLAHPSLSSPPFPASPMQLQPLCNGLLHSISSPGRVGPLILTPAAAALAEQQGALPSPRSLRRRQQQSDEDDLFPHSTPLRLPTLHSRTPPTFVGDVGEALPLLAVGDHAASPSTSTGGPFALQDATMGLEHPPPHTPTGPPSSDEEPATFTPTAPATHAQPAIRRARPRHSEASPSGRPIGAFGGSSSRGGGREAASSSIVRKRPTAPPPPAGLCVTSSLCYRQRPSPSSFSPPLGGSPYPSHPEDWGGSPVGPSTQGFAMRAALRRPGNGAVVSSQHQPARDRRQQRPLRRRASLRPLQATAPLAELQIGRVE